jgi:hypothetical protein
VIPAYGTGALSDVTPAAAAALGVPGFRDVLGLPAARHVVLLLVDGLGWELLRGHEADAPFLAGLAGRPVTAGFPSTTATSLASVGTGLPPGGHGLVGMAFEVADPTGPAVLHPLSWRDHGTDLRERFVPEDVQPEPTVFARMAAAGVGVRTVLPALFLGSGLTRAALRGGEAVGIRALGDLAAAATAAPEADRTFRYAYHGDLDLLGHVYGPGSDEWRFQLGQVDQLARSIADRLPAGGLLLVTADHGMVAAAEADRVDVEDDPALTAGVRLVAGEPRARHVYARPGAAADVRAAWAGTLGARAEVLTRDEAVAAGWFGPVPRRVAPRIGDVVAVPTGTTVLVRPTAEPTMTTLTGHHGALTPAELLIPALHHAN